MPRSGYAPVRRTFRTCERCATLAMRRMHHHGSVFLMHLPDRRHSRERNRDAKGENEREKCQTWSHCKTSFWNWKINAIDYSWLLSIGRARSVSGLTHGLTKTRAAKLQAFGGRESSPAGFRRPASPVL